MAWDGIEFSSDSGRSVSPADRQEILSAAEAALLLGDEDPDVVMRVASEVGRHMHVIENLRAYVSRAIFRASRRQLARAKKDPLLLPLDLSMVIDDGKSDQIENRILVRELLETLAPQDREIVVRRMSGDSFPGIDNDLNLKPRTAESRYRASLVALRKTLRAKLGNRL